MAHVTFPRRIRLIGMIVLFAGLAGLILWSGAGSSLGLVASKVGGDARMVSFEPFPEIEGEICPIDIQPASASTTLVAALQQSAGAQRDQAAGAAAPPFPNAEVRDRAARRQPAREIRDPNAAFSAVALDFKNQEVVLQDENTFGINIYNMSDNTPPGARMTEPKRTIRGEDTFQEFNCAIYVDPANGDIYSVNNDTLGILSVYDRSARGNAKPKRLIATGGLYGIAADEETGELFLASQGGGIRVYSKEAQGRDRPVRTIGGPSTQLADSHGLAFDPKRGEVFIVNWGTGQKMERAQPGQGGGGGEEGGGGFREIAGSGYADEPSITVFPKSARGDVAPLRVIRGPKTQMNWPTGIAVDPDHGEIFVANDTGNSITVYPLTAQGDVAPIRVIKGPRSRVSNPKGIAYDPKNDEIFVANFSNHAMTVYKRTANGDTPPVRMIRSAPIETPAPMMGNPHTVVYNPNREEILVGQ